jgi:hypothetical protein
VNELLVNDATVTPTGRHSSILCRSAIFPDLMVIFPCRDLVSASHAPHNNNNNNNNFNEVQTVVTKKKVRMSNPALGQV